MQHNRLSGGQCDQDAGCDDAQDDDNRVGDQSVALMDLAIWDAKRLDD